VILICHFISKSYDVVRQSVMGYGDEALNLYLHFILTKPGNREKFHVPS